MKKALLLILLFISTTSFAQLTLSTAKTAAEEYNFRSYSYHEDFEGHNGYAAPIILLANGSAIFFGDANDEESVNLVQLDKEGNPVWQTPISARFNEMETQSVVQDKAGNFYAFILSYNYSKYRGSSERVIYLDKDGKVLWDKALGDYTLKNNPHCSYIRLLDDGLLALRGHIVTDAAKEGDDPEYHFWQGWLNNKGEWTQEIGGVIDWADPSWKDFYKVEN